MYAIAISFMCMYKRRYPVPTTHVYPLHTSLKICVENIIMKYVIYFKTTNIFQGSCSATRIPSRKRPQALKSTCL